MGRVATAVVVDRLPLLRIGIRRAVDEAGFSICGEATDLGEGLELLRRTSAGLVVVGDVESQPAAALGRAVGLATVVGLVGAATREQLAAAFTAGVGGLALRSSSAGELADVVRRAARGERALAPALLPALAGVVGPAGAHAALRRPVPEAGELTARELRVLAALAAGASNAEIAAELYVSIATVKTHLAHIYTKLRVRDRQEALRRAVALGLVG